MYKTLIYSLTVFIFAACQNGRKGNLTIDTLKIDTTPKEEISKKNIDSSETKINKQGMFSVNNLQFQYIIKENDTGIICTIQKFDNGKWVTNFSYNYSSRTDSMLQDVNNDGYPDIFNSWRNWAEAFLYNKETKTFDSTLIPLEYKRSLIDTTKNIFCNNRQVKENQEASRLYTFRGLDVEVLYSLKFKTKRVEEEDFPIILEFELYKGDFENPKTSKFISTTKVPRGYEFDYLNFWKARYKELLGYP